MASPVPYLSVLASIAILGYATVQLPPSSPYRPLAVLAVVPFIVLTVTTGRSASPHTGWNCVLAVFYGPLLFMEIIKHTCVDRLYFHANQSENGSGSLRAKILWTLDITFNKRRVGWSRPVKTLPNFSSKNPSYTPSRTQFLIFRTIRLILSYLFVDFAMSFPMPDLQPQGPSLATIVIGLWCASCIYLVQSSMYDLYSVISVGLHLSGVEAWPPRFGSLYEVYSVRRFWGVFWHQDLRLGITSSSEIIVLQVFRLKENSLVARYAKIFCAFFLSGALHILADHMINIPFWESGALRFFVSQAIAITIEDGVQGAFRGFRKYQAKSTENSEPLFWQRLVGFIWVAFFLLWISPVWVYPVMKITRGSPMPIKVF